MLESLFIRSLCNVGHSPLSRQSFPILCPYSICDCDDGAYTIIGQLSHTTAHIHCDRIHYHNCSIEMSQAFLYIICDRLSSQTHYIWNRDDVCHTLHLCHKENDEVVKYTILFLLQPKHSRIAMAYAMHLPLPKLIRIVLIKFQTGLQRHFFLNLIVIRR